MLDSNPMTLDNQTLDAQLSIVELLLSMFYGEGELDIDDDSTEVITALRDRLITSNPTQVSAASFLDVHVRVYMAVSNSQSLVLTVILHLRMPGSTSNTSAPLIELSLKHPSWISRVSYQQILDSFPPYTGSSTPDVQGAEDGRDWLTQVIEHLQSESTLSRLATTPSSPNPSPNPTPESTLITRTWFYLPSLSTRSKRTDIITLARRYSITGFVLAGKPGLLCLESSESLGPDAFIARIKTESWADIPSHQKKITERYRETGVGRAFETMDEVTELISTRGARANRGDMGEVRVFLEERGLKGVLEVVLGAEFK